MNHRIPFGFSLLAAAVSVLAAQVTWAQEDHAGHHTATMTATEPSGTKAMDAMKHSHMPAMVQSAPQPAEKPTTGSQPAPMDHGHMRMQGGDAPADARDPHAYSGGYTLDAGPYVLSDQRQLRLADELNFGSVLVDRLEWTKADEGERARYDVQAWFGRDYDRLVLKAEGEVVSSKLEDARTELLWGHAIANYWDAQVGIRYDSGVGPDRSWLAIGLQGLAPYWFEVDATAYVGEAGRTALTLAAEYDLLLTQKWVLQPRTEWNLFGKSNPDRGVGEGLSDGMVGVRLRYDGSRQFSPYVGVEWKRKFGATADLARAAGSRTSDTRWAAGVRFWF